jgi:hypothetical protein
MFNFNNTFKTCKARSYAPVKVASSAKDISKYLAKHADCKFRRLDEDTYEVLVSTDTAQYFVSVVSFSKQVCAVTITEA